MSFLAIFAQGSPRAILVQASSLEPFWPKAFSLGAEPHLPVNILDPKRPSIWPEVRLLIQYDVVGSAQAGHQGFYPLAADVHMCLMSLEKTHKI